MFCMRVPLTHLSMKAILQWSSYEMRRKLAERVVSMREINKKVPFNFNQVKFSIKYRSEFTVQIDETSWVFKTQDRRAWTRECKMFLVKERGKLRVSVTVRVLHALVQYFFTGKTRKVNRLVIKDFQICPDLICIPIIGLVIFDSPFYVSHSLEAFHKSTIDKMVVNIDGVESDWSYQLSKIRCNSAKVTTSVRTSSTFYNNMQFPKTEIREYFPTVNTFLNVLKMLERAKNLEEYSYCSDSIDNGTELWERLKSQYCIEEEHRNFLLIRIDGLGFKILVERWIGCIGYVHRVQKVTEGTEVTLEYQKNEKNNRYQIAACFTE